MAKQTDNPTTDDYVLGVDGCRHGWFAVAISNRAAGAGSGDFTMFESIDALWHRHRAARLILIDIPIGLPFETSRACDLKARAILGRRASSVFPPPCREAVNARTYRSACSVNQRRLGKKLSVETWNICPKILEVDQFLRSNRNARRVFREAHPEVCFCSLARGKPMQFSKKTREGLEERRRTLARVFKVSGRIFKEAQAQYLRKDLARDDILDALVLAVIAATPSADLANVAERTERDERGLPMEIVVPRPR